jgi:hypothetical protein
VFTGVQEVRGDHGDVHREMRRSRSSQGGREITEIERPHGRSRNERGTVDVYRAGQAIRTDVMFTATSRDFKEIDRAGCHITIQSGDLAVERDDNASP